MTSEVLFYRYNIISETFEKNRLFKYYYQNSRLKEYERYEFYGGNQKIEIQGVFEYKDDEVSLLKMYEGDVNIYTSREEYLYHDGLIQGFIEYTTDDEISWQQSYKYEYLYAEKNIVERNFYHFGGDQWWLDRKTIYGYDENNNLNYVLENDGAEYEYSYKKANGNAEIFQTIPHMLVKQEPSVDAVGHENNRLVFEQKKRL